MKKFTFQLSSILRIREYKEAQTKMKFAKENAVRGSMQNTIDTHTQEQEHAKGLQVSLADKLLYVDLLDVKKRSIHAQIKAQSVAFAQAREEYHVAREKAETLRILQDTQKEHHRVNELRRSSVQADELQILRQGIVKGDRC